MDKHEEELRSASSKIISSNHPKKILVAGPGAGKTTSFLRLLEARKYKKEKCLIFTFLGVLKKDLEVKLERLASVFTFHGYCLSLLKRFPELRENISNSFNCFPRLTEIIAEDWRLLENENVPDFVKYFQSATHNKYTDFFISRSNYYDAVSFDDSVFRVWSAFERNIKVNTQYDLILVDEAQDFNKLEVSFIYHLAKNYPILIAGDDDQAIYEELRSADPKYIQEMWKDSTFERHNLPYCTRCTKVIIDAYDDIISVAKTKNLFNRRIPKRFSYYPPLKGPDSERYQKIRTVCTSVYSKKSNYFVEYIKKEINKISKEEVRQSREDGNPTVLIMAPTPYRDQILSNLVNSGFNINTNQKKGDDLDRISILRKISENFGLNLWWRVLLFIDQPIFIRDVLRKAKGDILIKDILPKDYLQKIDLEMKNLPNNNDDDNEILETKNDVPTIQITSFEGAKGLSAYHTFIIGLQDGVLPINSSVIKEREVRKFLVALTRAKKQCHIVFTKRPFGNIAKQSTFIDWIDTMRKDYVYVDRSI